MAAEVRCHCAAAVRGEYKLIECHYAVPAATTLGLSYRLLQSPLQSPPEDEHLQFRDLFNRHVGIGASLSSVISVIARLDNHLGIESTEHVRNVI